MGTPTPRFDEAKKLIYLDIDIDEGKPFYVSRIEFTGNTITRDKVIRRELLLDEGQIYNSQLWELSILRLNQLNYFEPLKVDQDSESRQNADDGTVDLLLKLKEKGKNSIGLNGGISGLQGTFIGLNYETNNFLGLGETLSVEANIGDLSRRPDLRVYAALSAEQADLAGRAGVHAASTTTTRRRATAIANGQSQNLTNAQTVAADELQHSDDRRYVVGEQPLRHLFAHTGVARVGVSYSLSRSSVTTFNDNTRNVFQSLAFRSGVQGQNQLNGIVTFGDHAELLVLEPGPRRWSA